MSLTLAPFLFLSLYQSFAFYLVSYSFFLFFYCLQFTCRYSYISLFTKFLFIIRFYNVLLSIFFPSFVFLSLYHFLFSFIPCFLPIFIFILIESMQFFDCHISFPFFLLNIDLPKFLTSNRKGTRLAGA